MKKKTSMRLFSFFLHEQTLGRLREHAEETGMSVSRIVRHAVVYYLWEYGRGFVGEVKHCTLIDVAPDKQIIIDDEGKRYEI